MRGGVGTASRGSESTGRALAACLLAAAGCRVPVAAPAADQVAERLRVGGAVAPGGALARGAPAPEELVDLADGLDEDEAVALALWGDPGFGARLAELDVARARLEAAGRLSDPVLTFLFPFGSKPYEGLLRWPLEELWQRPARVAAAELDARRLAEDLVREGLDVARDARLAHADWVRARDARGAQAELAAIAERRLELERARRDAGDGSAADVASAERIAAAARAERRAAERDVAAAAERLWARAGCVAPRTDVEPVAPPVSDLPRPDPARLTALALTSRPEVVAEELSLRASAERLDLAERSAVRASALFDFNDAGGFEAGPGVDVSLPVLEGGRSAEGLARAELVHAEHRLEAAARRVRVEVVEALGRERRAAEALSEWADLLVAGREELGFARRAHALGELSGLDVAAAEARLAALGLREAELVHALRRARIELERAVGRPLDGEDRP